MQKYPTTKSAAYQKLMKQLQDFEVEFLQLMHLSEYRINEIRALDPFIGEALYRQEIQNTHAQLGKLQCVLLGYLQEYHQHINTP